MERQICGQVFRDQALMCGEVIVTEHVEPPLHRFGRVHYVDYGPGHSEH